MHLHLCPFVFKKLVYSIKKNLTYFVFYKDGRGHRGLTPGSRLSKSGLDPPPPDPSLFFFDPRPRSPPIFLTTDPWGLTSMTPTDLQDKKCLIIDLRKILLNVKNSGPN